MRPANSARKSTVMRIAASMHATQACVLNKVPVCRWLSKCESKRCAAVFCDVETRQDGALLLMLLLLSQCTW